MTSVRDQAGFFDNEMDRALYVHIAHDAKNCTHCKHINIELMWVMASYCTYFSISLFKDPKKESRFKSKFESTISTVLLRLCIMQYHFKTSRCFTSPSVWYV